MCKNEGVNGNYNGRYGKLSNPRSKTESTAVEVVTKTC